MTGDRVWAYALSCAHRAEADLAGLLSLRHRDSVPWYLFTIAVLVALYLHRRAGGRSLADLLAFLFPPAVWRHPSARLDVRYFLVQLAVGATGLGSLVIAASHVSARLLPLVPRIPAASHLPALAAAVAFTAGTVAAKDFGGFLSHYLMHKNPVLWEFHKTHHSAEVLVPFTNLREHPLEGVLRGSIEGVLTGVVTAVFVASWPQLHELTVLGVNCLYLPFSFTAVLRHTHVRVGFGPTLSRLLISPEMHHVHHGTHPAHVDKNFGRMLAIWDRMFGTLHVPAPDEPIEIGLAHEPYEFEGVLDLYLVPFRGAWRRLHR